VADADLDLSFDLLGISLAHSGTISFCFFDFAGLRARRPPSPSDSLADLALGSGDRSIGDAIASGSNQIIIPECHSRGLATGRFLFLTKKFAASSSLSDTTTTGSAAFSFPLTDIYLVGIRPD
jgi:hypothetical protein